MTWEMVVVFALLGLSFALMVWERVSLDMVAMLAFCVLLVAGILTPAEAFKVFGNDAPITVACMFILSAALERTGVIDSVAHWLNKAVGRSYWTVLLVMLPIVAVLSAFINNTPVVVVFMPIMISLAASRELKPSKLLIPLSFASIFGGLCTLIGSSTNILVSSTAKALGQQPLGMFELGRAGWILAAVGLAYLLLIGRKLLPDRETLASLLQSTETKQYLTEVLVAANSPLVGKKLEETPLANQTKARVIEIIRGGQLVYEPLNEIVLKTGDRLRLTTPLASVLELNKLKGVEMLPKAALGVELVGAQKAVVAECVIGPRSSLIGRSIRDVNFRSRYGVLVLAVHRQGVNLQEDFADVKLHYGDTLLVEGPEGAMNQLRGHRDFLLLLDVPETAKRRQKQVLALGAIGLVVLLATLNVLPIAALALMAAVLVVVTGCLDVDEAYESVDWKIIFLIFGMLALGMAMEKTHGAEFIAHSLIRALGGWGPLAALAAVVVLTSTLTNFLSNNAVAVLLTPIAIQAAVAMDVSARPFLVAVALGASACFATPIGYQTNTLVYGAGGYKFRDFLKVGLPLNILFCVLAVYFIPKFWPF
ncbi:MAG TPA: SLC13 family permease [Verrucomicrobiota bacterium]|nr:SLC13 family permease [Verrucomicrobiota bacterium]